MEAAHVVGSYAADGPSRWRLLAAYGALARRSWSPIATDAQLRMGRSTLGLRFRPQDIYVIGEILHGGVYRVRSALPPRPVIVDAGANIGLATLWLSAHYPQARFHCFEPEGANFAILQHNLLQIPEAQCWRAALGAQTGEIALHVTPNCSDHSVLDPGVAATRTEIVPSLRLRDFMDERRIERIDLLKLDVEGSELAVLQGLGEYLSRVGVIVGELHERLVDKVAFYDLLRRHGFRIVARWDSRGHPDEHMFEVAR